MPNGFSIGPLSIRFYGIIIMVGVLAAAWLASKEAKRRGLDSSLVWDGLIWVILAGVIINIALYAILVQMYNFLTKIQELSMLNTVLALAPILLGVFFLGVLATRLMLHFGMRRSLSIGLLVLAIPPSGVIHP